MENKMKSEAKKLALRESVYSGDVLIYYTTFLPAARTKKYSKREKARRRVSFVAKENAAVVRPLIV